MSVFLSIVILYMIWFFCIDKQLEWNKVYLIKNKKRDICYNLTFKCGIYVKELLSKR